MSANPWRPIGDIGYSGNSMTLDKRTQQTRSALVGAFNHLVLRRRYHDINVQDITEVAGVGRSTLYEHFHGKDSILTTSLVDPLSVLADSIQVRDNTQQLIPMLEHFWSNREVARSFAVDPLRRKAMAVLVGLVEVRLKPDRVGARALIIPVHLAAVQLSEGLFAAIMAWLAGDSRCAPEALACALRKTATASVEALSQRQLK